MNQPQLLLIGGNGKWGQIYSKNLYELNIPFKIADRKDWRQQLTSGKYQGVIIATPADSHVEIAQESLKHNLPTLLEKPASLSVNELLPLYAYQDVPILINHIHLFSSDFLEIYRGVAKEEINKITSTGFGFGPFHFKHSPIFEWCHDFAMSLFLAKETPTVLEIEEIKTSIGSLYQVLLQYSTFQHSLLIGNGAERKQKSRLFEVNYAENQTILYNDLPEDKTTKVTVNHQPHYDYLSTGTPIQNLLESFISTVNLGVKSGYTHDDRWGLDLGKKVVEVAQQCQQKLLVN